MEEREVEDSRDEGSSEIGDGGQVTISLLPHTDGTYFHIFESLQLEVSYRGDLLLSTF